MRHALLFIVFATVASAAATREYWISIAAPGLHESKFVVQVPRHPIKLEGKPVALYVNGSDAERVVALYGGDEPESLLARVRGVVSAPSESCEVRWTGADGKRAGAWWLVDRHQHLLVARRPRELYDAIMKLRTWGVECGALHLESGDDAFSPSHLEEGSSVEVSAALDSTGGARRPNGTFVEQLPDVVSKVPPQYPESARQWSVQGVVLVQALLGTTGNVERLFVIQSIPDLDVAALDAVQQWKFKPAASGGKPVAVWVVIPVRFTLH
jgi:protein TonB